MQITIAICTYNRDYILEKSVLAALAQDNALDYEVLVVDNNSTDNTALLIQGMVAGNPRLRPVKELRQGLSFARNRAVKESRGDYLVFVDDDAVLCPDYLKKLHKLLCRIPHPGAAGGPVSLGWMRPAPSWYEPGLDIWYNRLDHGTRRCFLEYPQILYGTNMVFSKEILERVGGFRTGLGRSGKGLGDSEDLEIMLRIAKAGLPVVYDPELLVTHYITPDRLSRGVSSGKSQAARAIPVYGGVNAPQGQSLAVPGLMGAFLGAGHTPSGGRSFFREIDSQGVMVVFKAVEP